MILLNRESKNLDIMFRVAVPLCLNLIRFSRLIVRFRVNIIYRFGQKDLDIMARKRTLIYTRRTRS